MAALTPCLVFPLFLPPVEPNNAADAWGPSKKSVAFRPVSTLGGSVPHCLSRPCGGSSWRWPPLGLPLRGPCRPLRLRPFGRLLSRWPAGWLQSWPPCWNGRRRPLVRPPPTGVCRHSRLLVPGRAIFVVGFDDDRGTEGSAARYCQGCLGGTAAPAARSLVVVNVGCVGDGRGSGGTAVSPLATSSLQMPASTASSSRASRPPLMVAAAFVRSTAANRPAPSCGEFHPRDSPRSPAPKSSLLARENSSQVAPSSSKVSTTIMGRRHPLLRLPGGPWWNSSAHHS